MHNRYIPDIETQYAYGMKSGAALPWCNRVMAKTDVTTAEVLEIKDFFGEIPFRWFVQDSDAIQINTLKDAGLQYICDYPAMSMDLSQLTSSIYQPEITVREMISACDEVIWLSVSQQAFGIAHPSEFKKFIDALKQRAGSMVVRLYTAYYGDIPAAVSIVFDHGDIIALHWVGTIPAYRKKGLGFAASHSALLEAKKNGYKTALLFASPMGKPLYEKIGFKEYAMYKIFGK